MEARKRLEFQCMLKEQGLRFAVVIERAGKNLSAYAPDLPGVIATGRDRDEVSGNMRAALLLHLLGLWEAEGAVPQPRPWDELRSEVELEATDEVVELEPAEHDPVSYEILEAIERSNVSHAEVARRMGTSRSTLSRLTNPVYHGHSMDSLRRLGEALGLEVSLSFERKRSEEAGR